MRLLLDSQSYLWWVIDNSRLSAQAKAAIANAAEVFVSFVTPWEFEIKVAGGKLNLPQRIWSDFAADRTSS